MWAKVGYSGSAVERWPIDRGDQGFSPPATNLKFGQFCSPNFCLCLSEETIKQFVPSSKFIWCLSFVSNIQ